jgi:hypothetical protein
VHYQAGAYKRGQTAIRRQVHHQPSCGEQVINLVGYACMNKPNLMAFKSSAQSQPVIASRILLNASSSSFPWETQPGRAGIRLQPNCLQLFQALHETS